METMKTIAYVCLALIGVSISYCVLQAMTHTNVAVRRRYLSVAAGGTTILLVGMLYLFVFIPILEKNRQANENTEMQVFTADTITIQEKYISGDGLFTDGDCYLVLTDGEETVRIKVTEATYDKYKVGDIYEHDADPKDYREN